LKKLNRNKGNGGSMEIYKRLNRKRGNKGSLEVIRGSTGIGEWNLHGFYLRFNRNRE
jgi:hypothetical protein